ncbi:pheromone-regulated protein prm10 [Coemansia sp. RSA 988]|nr:pheromone-regulated protein prm10 [Coemansia sp. RSA 988]
MNPLSPDKPANNGHRSHARRRIRPYDSSNSTPPPQSLRGTAHTQISDQTQYHPLPDGLSQQHRRPAVANLLRFPDSRQQQQHQHQRLPEDNNAEMLTNQYFELPPLDSPPVSTAVPSPTSARSDKVSHEGLYMAMFNIPQQQNHALDSIKPPENGTHELNASTDESRMIYFSAPSSATNTPQSTPCNSPSLHPKILPDTRNSVPPHTLEERSADGDLLNKPARSNFDANYLATLGKDKGSIAIHVDNRKRARSMLRRFTGRSFASGSGGILSNLIRLRGVVSGNNTNQADEGGARRQRHRIHEGRGVSPLVNSGGRSPLGIAGRRMMIPDFIRNIRHPKRTHAKDRRQQIRSVSTAAPTLTCHSSETLLPISNANHHIRRSFSTADVSIKHVEKPPDTWSESTGSRSVPSARRNAMMITSEAFAKNGIIPPPSTQGALRMGRNTASGYFEIASPDSSLASTPLHDPAMSPSYDEREELIDRIAQILEKQDFLMHLTRAWHSFGSPVHRMESNLMEVTRYLDIEAHFFTIPGLTLISFGDPDAHSSETHIVRASSGYDMYRLEQANNIAWRLRKGNATVHESIRDIESLMAAPPIYNWYLRMLFCFMQSFFVSTTLFRGSWKEAAISGAMGMVVSMFETFSSNYITIGYLLNVIPPIIVALVAALLSDHICFSAVPMAANINLLPGMGLALAMLELSSSNYICGAVRLISATMSSFMIGWGTIVGYNLGMAILGKEGQSAGTLSNTECSGLTMLWWFLFVPLSTIGFGVWFKVHWSKWPAIVFAAASGLVIQTFCDRVAVMTPLSSGIASFAVGMFSNIYGHFTHSTSNASIVFVGIIQLVPGSTGVKSFVSFLSADSSASSLTMSMLSTAISIAVGLLLSNSALYSDIKRYRLGSF